MEDRNSVNQSSTYHEEPTPDRTASSTKASIKPVEPLDLDPHSTDMGVKQAMLRDELLEQGFDGEEFVRFIETDLNHKNLEDWTVSELRKVLLSYAESSRV